MIVWIVSLEWNDPPSEVCGDTGIVGVYATEAAAQAAATVERRRIIMEDGQRVYGFCGHGDGIMTVEACDESGEACDDDHDAWDLDVHVTQHTVIERRTDATDR